MTYSEFADAGQGEQELTYGRTNSAAAFGGPPRIDPLASPWRHRLCIICTEPIPPWRDFVSDVATRMTCFDYHAEMYLAGEEEEWEVHDVPYWKPGREERD